MMGDEMEVGVMHAGTLESGHTKRPVKVSECRREKGKMPHASIFLPTLTEYLSLRD